MTLTQPVFESVVGAGAMINWITVPRKHMAVYEDWYNYQHLPERVSTPGFLRARRFIAAQHRDPDRLDYLTLYETTTVEVLASPQYLRRLDNPTALTLDVVPLFTDFHRAACQVTVIRGHGSSGRVMAVEVDSGSDRATLRSALADSVFPTLIEEHRLVAASLYEPDAAVTDAKNATVEGQSLVQQQTSSSVVLAELHRGVDPARLVADMVARAAGTGARFDQPEVARCFDLVYELRSASPTPNPYRGEEPSCG